MCMTMDPMSVSGTLLSTGQVELSRYGIYPETRDMWAKTLQGYFKFSALTEAQTRIDIMVLEEHSKQDRTTASVCLCQALTQLPRISQE